MDQQQQQQQTKLASKSIELACSSCNSAGRVWLAAWLLRQQPASHQASSTMAASAPTFILHIRPPHKQQNTAHMHTYLCPLSQTNTHTQAQQSLFLFPCVCVLLCNSVGPETVIHAAFKRKACSVQVRRASDGQT